MPLERPGPQHLGDLAGVALCTGCEGSAYGLGGVGSYFKIYVGNSTHHLSARVTSAYGY